MLAGLRRVLGYIAIYIIACAITLEFEMEWNRNKIDGWGGWMLKDLIL